MLGFSCLSTITSKASVFVPPAECGGAFHVTNPQIIHFGTELPAHKDNLSCDWHVFGDEFHDIIVDTSELNQNLPSHFCDGSDLLIYDGDSENGK